MAKHFGTDGIRNKAECFTAEFLGKVVLGLVNYANQCGIAHPKILIGGDTRESSEWILADLASALETIGIEYGSVEVLPTPGINCVFVPMGFDFAIDVTASHNPYTDNGIKIFERNDLNVPAGSSDIVPTGRKLSPEGATLIEQAIDGNQTITPISTEPIESLHEDALDRYLTHLIDYTTRIQSPGIESPANPQPLAGLKVALDCANGSTSVVGGQVFERLGADVTVFNRNANYGQDINAGTGSTHLDHISEIVKQGDFDFGAAFDGDGDRCLLVDSSGETISGDQIIAIFANYLSLDKLVVTVMANQGLYDWAKKSSVELVVTDVGDTNVFLAMRREHILLGGEESGHIILPREPMGDGMLVALFMGKIIATTGQSLAELASIMPRFPQITTNVPANDTAKSALRSVTAKDSSTPSDDLSAELQQVLRQYQEDLALSDGRLLVRPSGTEALVRITIWGKELSHIENISRDLSAKLTSIFDKF